MKVKIFLLLGLYILQVAARPKVNEAKEAVCTGYKHKDDFKNVQQLISVQDRTLRNLWSRKSLTLSENGKTLKAVISDMAKSKNILWRSTALVASQWIWAYLPHVDNNPNVCAFAKMINSTASFAKVKNCDTINSAIDAVFVSMGEGTMLSLDTGLRNAECADINTKPPKTSDTKCESDGYKYDFEKVWSTNVEKYPETYKNAVSSLYSSTSKADKLIALLATVSVSPHFAILENQFDPALKYQLFAMLVSPKVSTKCCDVYREEATELITLIGSESSKMIGVAKKAAGC